MNHGGNGWFNIHYFSGYGQIITKINQETVGSPGLLVVYPDSGNLSIPISSQIKPLLRKIGKVRKNMIYLQK